MHCTVHPGRLLHVASPVDADAKPYPPASEAAKMPDCDARSRWCQEQTTQDIGVRLQTCGFPVKLQRPRLRSGIDQFPSSSRESLLCRPMYWMMRTTQSKSIENQFYPAYRRRNFMTTTGRVTSIWVVRFAPCRILETSGIGPLAYPRRNSRIDPAVREHHFDSHRQCRCLDPLRQSHR